jgi:hypothetical protein
MHLGTPWECLCSILGYKHSKTPSFPDFSRVQNGNDTRETVSFMRKVEGLGYENFTQIFRVNLMPLGHKCHHTKSINPEKKQRQIFPW